MRTGTIVLTCAALVLVTAAASAEPSPAELPHTMRLEYRVSPEAKRCPADGEHLLRSAVTVHMRADPFDATAPARLVATVRQTASGYIARAELLDEAGAALWSREIIPLPVCDSAIETIAFAIAFRLDPPRAAPAPPAPAPVPTPPPPPPVCVAPPAPARPAEPPTPRPPVEPPDPRRVLVGAGAAVGFGVASAPALGFTADLGIRWPFASLSAEGSTYLPARVNAPGTAEVVSTYRVTGAIIPCGHWRAFAVCVPIEVGTQQGRAEPSGRKDGDLYVAAGFRVGAELPLSRGISVRVAGDALFARNRPHFLFNDAVSWDPPLVSGALHAGFVTYF